MRRLSWTAVALAVLTVGAGERGALASSENGVSHRAVARRIEGTWSLQITLANCQTGEEIPGATFPGLNAFLPKGSMLSDPAANPALLRTGYGAWTHLGGRRFANTVVLFRFNPDGSYAGTQTVRRNIEVSHGADELVSLDVVTSADVGGTIVDTRCAIGRGRRLAP